MSILDIANTPIPTTGTVPVITDKAPGMFGLAGYIRRVFERNVEYRRQSGIDDRLLKCLRMSERMFDPDEEAKIRSRGAPAIYAPIADTKRRAAMAMLSEIFSNPGDKPWTFTATPLPEVPKRVTFDAVQRALKDWLEFVSLTGEIPPPRAVVEYTASRMDEILAYENEWARKRAKLAEKAVHDKMVEGGWIDAFSRYVNYICTYGTAIIKGPVPRKRMVPSIVENDLGVVNYKMKEKVVLEYHAISPWDCFPSPGSRDIKQGKLCLRIRFTPEELRQFGNGDQWRQNIVDQLLDLNPDGGWREEVEGDAVRRHLEDDVSDASDDSLLEGIEFFGDVRGKLLRDLKLTKTATGGAIKESNYYEVHAITIRDAIVFCRVIEPELGRPLSKGVFYEAPESWWGESPVEKSETAQRVCNSSLISLVVNMAQASGPQTVINDITRLHPKCDVTQSPWKVWVFKPGMGGGSDGNPMHMFTPDSNANELTKVFDWSLKQADSDTGIPAYSYGSNISAGAARTASGLAILTEAASRGMKMVINKSDADVTRDVVKRTYAYLLIYDKDESIKGDVQINPSGVMGLILREQSDQKLFNAMNIVANPVYSQIVGPKGLAALLRKHIERLDLNPDEIIPSPEKLEELEKLAMLKQQIELAQGAQEAQGEPQEQEQPQQAPQGGRSRSQPVKQPNQGDPRNNPMGVAMRGANRFQAPEGGI